MDYDLIVKKKNAETNIEFLVKIIPVPTTHPKIEYRQGTSLWLVQKAYVLSVLERNNWHRANSADELCICIRTLQKYINAIRKDGIPVPDYTRPKRGKRPITIDTY